MKLKLDDLPESIKKLNPDLFRSALASLADPKRQPDQRSQSKDRVMESLPPSFRFCITIISLRKRLVDGHDNLRTGAKPLADFITEKLGFSNDADKHLEWHYEQYVTAGEPGTIVQITARGI